MNVQLTPELEQMVHSKVKAKRYNSASDVITEALRLMDQRDEAATLHKVELTKKIAAGLKSLEEGHVYDGEEVFAQLEAEIAADIRAEDEQAKRERNGHR